MQINDFEIIRGQDDFVALVDQISKQLRNKTISIGFDLDGTLMHTTPGQHTGVPPELELESFLNDLYDHTEGQTFVLTGRPQVFAECVFPNRKFLVGTEHGSVISRNANDPFTPRVGDPDAIAELTARFNVEKLSDPLLKRVMIEDHKKVTGTAGFTDVINPEGVTAISQEALAHMDAIRDRLVNKLKETVDQLGIPNLEIVDTVTPTNAVVEMLPIGACKAASLESLRDMGLLKNQFTVFGGDSGGDARVMSKVRDELGIAVGVGPKAPDSSHIVLNCVDNNKRFFQGLLNLSTNVQPA